MANQSPSGIPNTNNSVNSITRQAKIEPFDLQVARGQIYGHSTVNIYGLQGSVTTSYIPIWENAYAYYPPSAAVVMTLVSSSASDTSAVRVTVNGLDANYNQISEIVALNGTTGVQTAKSYFRINSLNVTSGSNAGIITCGYTVATTGASGTGTAATITFGGSYVYPVGATITVAGVTPTGYNATAVVTASSAGSVTYANTTTGAQTIAGTVTQVYAQITATYGRSQMAIYTVPAGYTLYLSRIDAWTSANGYTADVVIYRNFSTSSSGVTSLSQQAPFINQYHTQRVMPRPFTEKTDIQLQAHTSSGTYIVSISAEAYLISNGT